MSKIKKLLSLVLFSGIIFSLLLVGCSNNRKITLTDKNLEKAIRVTIDKPTGAIFKSVRKNGSFY